MSANVLVVHGGGPTAVINASLYGVVEEAKSSGSIGRVYGAIGGSEGILKESFLDLMQYPEEKLSLLLQTPATAIGSSRYALKQEDYNAMAGIFRKYGIRYVLLNGGNGTMDTCGRIFEACRGTFGISEDGASLILKAQNIEAAEKPEEEYIYPYF